MLEIYSLENCYYSKMAENLIKEKKLKANIIKVPNDIKIKKKLNKKNKMNTYPQIFINFNENNKFNIGGYSELIEHINICNQIKNNKFNSESIFILYKNLFK